MKMLKLTTVALALIAAASFTTSAKAGSLSYSAGDLILGVYDASGTDPNSLEVNLGFESNLTDGETFSLASDLTSAGLTSSSLVFAVAGTGGQNGANGLVADEVQLTAPGVIVVPTDTSTATTQINNEGTAAHGTPLTNVAGASPTAGYIANGNSGSFKSEVTGSGGNYGLASNAPSGVVASLAAGTVVPLYDFTGTADKGTGIAVPLGTFTVLANGTSVEFNAAAAAVPEPSTYALMGISGLALLWALKRRNSVV